MNEIDDLTLALAKKNDRAAFKKLYDHYVSFVWKVAFRTMNGDRNLTELAVQDTFIKVHRAIKNFGGGSAFSTWLYRIVYNACMSLHAQENKKNAMLPLTEDIAEKHNGNVVDIKDLVQRILSGLSADERYLITSREVLDISYEELAKITQKNEGSLRTQLSRLKENIRKKYGDML